MVRPIPALLALALAVLSAAPVLGQEAAPRTITMTGHGEVKAAPDAVTVNAGVTTNAATAAAALAANTTRMKSVFAALEKLGVPGKDIQTTNFSVSPQYAGGNNEPPRLTGYQVSNEVSLRLEDVGRLGGALDALVTAGANQMNGISFAIKDPAPLLKQARTEAIADARSRAETYAQAAGAALGPILSISEGGAVQALRPMYRMAMAAGAPVPVSAGQESVSAEVTLVWEIH